MKKTLLAVALATFTVSAQAADLEQYYCNTEHGQHEFLLSNGEMIQHIIREDRQSDRVYNDGFKWKHQGDGLFKHTILKDYTIQCSTDGEELQTVEPVKIDKVESIQTARRFLEQLVKSQGWVITDYHWTDTGASQFNNYNLVRQGFTAKNAFGVEFEYYALLRVNADGSVKLAELDTK